VGVTSHDSKALGRSRWLNLIGLTVDGHRLDLLMYGGTFLWGLLFATFAALEQHFFLLRRYDLGNFTQAVWSTAHGRFLQVTEVSGAEVIRLGIHVDPIIVGLVPLWWIWSSPDLLLVVQVSALAAGALPLYWLGRKHLQSTRDAALVSAAYLVSPALEWNALHEFDAVTLSVPLLLLCVWFLDEDRPWAFGAAAMLAVLCQEQIGLIVACLGAIYGWRTRRLAPAAVIVVLGLAVTLVDFRVILPHFSGGSPYSGRLMGVGGSPGGVFDTALNHPLRILDRVSEWHRLVGLGLLIVPVLGLCFRSAVMLAAVPQLALVLLSARIDDAVPWSQNILPSIPFIFAGTIYALAKSRRRKLRGWHILVASIACAALIGPLDPYLLPSVSLRHVRAESQAVTLVPPSASVSVTNHLGAHLATRRYLYVFPVIDKATWIIVDRRDPYLPDMRRLRSRRDVAVGIRDLWWQPELLKTELRKLENSPRWKQVFSSDGVEVFTREGQRRPRRTDPPRISGFESEKRGLDRGPSRLLPV
jgi:uncharacterized membrane protein